MTDRIKRLRRGVISTAAAIEISGSHLASLHAEVLAQARTGNTVQMVEPKRLSPREIGDRGIKLRTELDKAFNALLDSEKAGHANELTAIAVPYISAGMALEDAEGVLSAAGFSAPPAPRASEAQDRNKGAERHAIVAEIPQFSGRVFDNVEAYVMLLAPEQGLVEFIGRRHRMMYVIRVCDAARGWIARRTWVDA